MARNSIDGIKRIKYVFWGLFGLIIYVIIVLFYTQFVNGEEYQKRALSQWTSDISMAAKRGVIYDSEDVVLAQDGTVYMISVRPPIIKVGERERIARVLSELLDVDEEWVLKKLGNKNIEEAIIKRQVESSVVDEIGKMQLGSGVVASVDTKRYYPNGNMLSQIIGFTTIDGEGQSGLEKTYNKYLSGENGRVINEKDAKGQTIAYGVQEYIPPIDGCNIKLTVNSVAQSFLEKALAEAVEINNADNAQGIIMNPKTGEIIAIATKPDYDPNNPPRTDSELLNKLSRNKVISDAYEPGSTFKILTLSAALDSGAVTTSTTFECPGYKIVNGQRIKCWRSGGHSHQSLAQAVANSCNPAFMTMALSMGTEKFYDYLYSFGIGSVTGVDMTGESAGIVTHEKYIKDTDLARIGFGQSVAVTPIQLVTAVSAAINGGELLKPYIVKSVIDSDGNIIKQNEKTVVRRVIKEETSAIVREILENVVENGGGKNAKIPGFRVGGKTGTAQKYDNGKVSSGKLIASFIGFAPADDPEFVCLILVDEPKVGTIFGSTVAAPFVKDVLEEVLVYYGFKPTEDTQTVAVPDVEGLTVNEALSKLAEVGLEGIYQEEDEVVAQLPKAGTQVEAGTQILLYTAKTDIVVEDDDEEETVTVPNLSGMTRLQALDALQSRGLVMELDEGSIKGRVNGQSVEAGKKVKVGTVVRITLNNIVE